MFITFGRSATASDTRHRHFPLSLRSKTGKVGAGVALALSAGCAGNNGTLGEQDPPGPAITSPGDAYSKISAAIKATNKEQGKNTVIGGIVMHRANQNSNPGKYFVGVACSDDGGKSWYLLTGSIDRNDSHSVRDVAHGFNSRIFKADLGQIPQHLINANLDIGINPKTGELQLYKNDTEWGGKISPGKPGQEGSHLTYDSHMNTINKSSKL
jgi:hypothetical protein